MAWVKVPPAHHALFHAALPKDPRISTMPMFGGIAAKVGGNIFAGLFGRSAIVRLNDADRAEMLALDGAEMFDPMGNGTTSKTSIQIPESMMDDPDDLKAWFRKAFDHALTLPAKKPPAKKPPAKKAPAKKVAPTVKKPASKPKARAKARR